MNTKHLIELLGGPSQVLEDTGLSKGRISQWGTADKIPRPWLEFYKLKRPDINWPEYVGHIDDVDADPEPAPSHAGRQPPDASKLMVATGHPIRKTA